jgi:hypothetical protein
MRQAHEIVIVNTGDGGGAVSAAVRAPRTD